MTVHCTIVVPTRDRPAHLAATLAALAALPHRAIAEGGGAEVVVVDNASTPAARVPRELANGLPATYIRCERNEGAAARTRAARCAAGAWLLMLDDDAAPLDAGFLAAIAGAPPEVAAIGGEILLPSGEREAGGLPEVIVGCGAAIRTAAYLAVGGYDPALLFYAEEYDLCAKLLATGHAVRQDARLRVRHARAPANRDPARIVAQLTRNEAIVAHRYAPDDRFAEIRRRWQERRRRVAEREGAIDAFHRALAEVDALLARERRTPLDAAAWDRFTGRTAARTGLAAARAAAPIRTVALALPPGPPGKHDEEIVAALAELDIERVAEPQDADVLLPATLAPNRAADACAWLRARHPHARVVAPWAIGEAPAPAEGVVNRAGRTGRAQAAVHAARRSGAPRP